MVFGHIYLNNLVYNWFYSFHMPLFFLAAGWIYKKKPILIDLKKRIQTIVIPYFSFGLLVLIYWQIIERKFRSYDMDFVDALKGLLMGSYNNLVFNVHMWFLPCFFITVILFNIFFNVLGKKGTYAISASMSLLYIMLPSTELIWGINRVFGYIGFFAIGVFLAEREFLHKKIELLVISIVLFTINFIFAYNCLTDGVMRYVTALIGVMGVVLIAQLISQNSILQYLGRISLVVLCIHGPVYRIIVKIISIPLNLDADAVRNNFTLSIVVAIITLSMCGVAYESIVRVAPWMLGKNHLRKK